MDLQYCQYSGGAVFEGKLYHLCINNVAATNTHTDAVLSQSDLATQHPRNRVNFSWVWLMIMFFPFIFRLRLLFENKPHTSMIVTLPAACLIWHTVLDMATWRSVETEKLGWSPWLWWLCFKGHSPNLDPEMKLNQLVAFQTCCHATEVIIAFFKSGCGPFFFLTSRNTSDYAKKEKDLCWAHCLSEMKHTGEKHAHAFSQLESNRLA